MLDDLINSPTLQPGNLVKFGQLYGSGRALILSQKIHQFKGLSVIICDEMAEAEQLQHEISYFSSGMLNLLHFPDLETLPYDNFSPHQDIISQRIRCLASLRKQQRGLLILPIATLLQKVAPPEFIAQQSFQIKINETLDLEDFKHQLTELGYRAVSQVEEHGEYASRGSILDLFPMGSDKPYRIDLFDNEIETIRLFDVENQCSTEKINQIILFPAHEFPLDAAGIKTFRQNFRQTFDRDPNSCVIYNDVSQGLSSPGIEYFLPLFFDQTVSLFDYFPENTQLLISQNAYDGRKAFIEQVEQRYESRRYNIERPILAPDDLYLNQKQLDKAFNQRPGLLFSTFKYPTESITCINLSSKKTPSLLFNKHAENPARSLQAYISNSSTKKILFSAESTGRREFLIELLKHYDIRVKQVKCWQDFLSNETDRLFIAVTPLEQGLSFDHPSICIITESQLSGERARQKRRRKFRKTRDSEALVQSLADLHENNPVVHEDHGIGRYRGLQTLTVGNMETEFLCIEYANNDKLYVPVSSLHLISRYTGAAEDKAPLHRLGTDHWHKVCRKARQKIHDVAVELLEIHARREALQGYEFEISQDEYQKFASDFPFEETPDQEKTIHSVIEDMQSTRPMDRIVCGDVGFGKTEVCMRAAFIAANSGKQVAILVPTTLLAQQHYQNFLDRFADWPIQIANISRFTSKKDLDKILQQLDTGIIDIIIGTHKLLSDNIKYHDLGLVVIDEEHRFGVRHKEKLKALRAQVDLLTMTATPIPRTLNMSLAGMRDLSIIATPPRQRLAIKTFVSQWNIDTILEGCQRELKRGGQIYFLHNEVRSIEKTARELQELLPQARIGIAHGQMKEKELEQVMLGFYHHRVNLLVCTTIIESGIDVPNANTIFINRADKLGLAQLHQIRGRVGRSHHSAFAYLIVPHQKSMTADAKKRLQAIESLEDLGVGFTLATHDLEIRGAGELLGDAQSGQINEIGFTLYSELLERAVQSLKAGNYEDFNKPLMRASEVDFHVPTLIPENYIPDIHLRLIEYKRISSAKTTEELKELKIELIDRFGLMPEPLINLFRISQIKQQSLPIGIEKIDFNELTGKILFNSKPNIDPMKIIQLLQTDPQQFSFDGKQTLRIVCQNDELEVRFVQLEKILGNFIDN